MFNPYPAKLNNLNFYSMMLKSWVIVYDDGPTFKQHWFNALCLLEVLIKDQGGGVRHSASLAQSQGIHIIIIRPWLYNPASLSLLLWETHC